MKVKSFQIKALSSQLQNGFDVVLFYGTDEGELNYALTELKKQLNISKKQLNFMTLSKEMLKKTPFLATDEANTSSLISERRFLFIPNDASFSVEALKHFLKNKKTDALLIIQAGNLSKSDTLRVESEKNPRILAVACYQPKLNDIQQNILSFFKTYNKTVSPNVLKEICQKISFNQEVINQELEKLITYLGDKKEVTLQDIDDCLTNNTEASLENFCIDLADGKITAVQNQLPAFLFSDELQMSLLWAVRNYFERLLLIVSDHSAPWTEVVKKNLKPSQFNLEIPLIRQTRFWNSKTLLTVLDKLTQLERLTRTTGYPKETIFSQAFLSLAQFAKKLTRLS